MSKPEPPNPPKAQKPSPPAQTEKRFELRNKTEAEENNYNLTAIRNMPKPCSVLASVMHIIKGALGGGFLSGHVAYMKAGVAVALIVTLLLGIYMTFTLHLLVWATQKLCRRTKVPSMSYPDVGECSFTVTPFKKLLKLAKFFRYSIDGIIMLDLFGSCCCYQIMISKTAKQLIENVQDAKIAGIAEGYPNLRVYLAIFMIPIICVCLITHLKWLAPFSLVANALILLCVFVTIYYSVQNNPTASNMILAKTFSGLFEMAGMITFSLSCAGVVIPIENNMKEPEKFPKALIIGMTLNTAGMIVISFFGYMGYLEKCDTPLTINFPMTTLPKIIKGCMAVMIYATHALNFWVPFNLCWWYLQRLHKGKNLLKWELIYRAIIVAIIAIISIIFPDIAALMGFLGTFCLSNMAFIWPNLIYLLVIWERPGLGRYKWRLIRGVILLVIGFILLVAGSSVNIAELVSVFVKVNIKKDEDEK